jgi:hypothetical protein
MVNPESTMKLFDKLEFVPSQVVSQQEEQAMNGTTGKNSVRELAVFSGRPAFKDPLHVGRPNIGRRERFLQLVNDIIDRRLLTNNGPLVQQFAPRN